MCTTRTRCYDLVSVVRDDNYTTCAGFISGGTPAYYTDFSLPISYLDHAINVTLQLVGENIGCSSADDGAFYIFPIASWNDSTGLIARRKTCTFQESTTVSETGQQKCAYNCKLSPASVALRIRRHPYANQMSAWKLCEVSNIFYGKVINSIVGRAKT